MSGLYHWLFSSDSLIIQYRGLELCIRPGDSCHVKSDRLAKWCEDGVIKSCYKSGVYVSYGHSYYFGSFTRGNVKFVALKDITELLRFPHPQALQPVNRNDLKVEEESLPS